MTITADSDRVLLIIVITPPKTYGTTAYCNAH